MNAKENAVGKDNFVDELTKLRNLVLLEAEENGDKYHILDIRRVKENDRFLSRFLLARKGNVEDAFTMAKTALEWRKNFGVHSITKDTIPSRYFDAGAVVPFNRDKKGNVVLLLRVKEYKRPSGEEEFVRKFIIYWLETMDREYNSEQITVVFNCKDCGISNLDMDLVRFMIIAFTKYYPRFLSCILVFDMPWLYSTAWRVIKSWLPENSVGGIKLVNRESVLEYIDKSQLHLEMGGEETVSAPLCNESQKRFTGKEVIVPYSCRDELLVHVNPSNELKFPHPSSTEALNSNVTFTISNVSKSTVLYRIKTTSRERYRAWPYTGFIQPGDHVGINAQLVDNAACGENDKFLILVTKINRDVLTNENCRFPTQSDAVVEYKLKCVMYTPPGPEKRIRNVSHVESSELKNLKDRLQHVEQNVLVLQQKQVFWLSFGCILLLTHILLDYREFLYVFIDYLY